MNNFERRKVHAKLLDPDNFNLLETTALMPPVLQKGMGSSLWSLVYV